MQILSSLIFALNLRESPNTRFKVNRGRGTGDVRL